MEDAGRPAGKRRFKYHLKDSFFSVLLLIQVLLIGLSYVFANLMIRNLREEEGRRTASITRHIQNEVRHRIYRSMLITLNVASDRETIEAFRKRDRQALLKVVTPTWKQLEGHSISQFHFHIPTNQGIVSFLRVHKPDIFGENLSAYRPLVVEAQLKKSTVSGLEQGKSGYGFRACAPVFYGDQLIGSVEIGSGFSEKFLQNLERDYVGKWSVVNLDRGVTTLSEDKTILGTVNLTKEEALTGAHHVPEEVLNFIRQGTPYHHIDRSSETVSLFVPLANHAGDFGLYMRYEYHTRMFERIRQVIQLSVLICLAGLILSGIILMILYRQVTNPIQELVQETDKIRDFNLDEKVDIKASLYELRTLVDAMANMKVGLQSFKKFVPSQLVRQLMETGLEASASGQRREVSIFFSDVADFTTISEAMKPSELASHLTEYFNEMTNIIMENQGTVDKYIGDAIMAFWNAPLELKDHAQAACRSALRIQDSLRALEKKWVAQEKPVFRTRIGLNTGDVVVGNMGSDQRLNYTVIGDPVNLASRLEALNKYYGSSIIISQFTYEKCSNDFEVRTLDYVLVKGKTKAVSIYELLAEKGDISTLDKEYNQYYEEAVALYLQREWARAMEIFEQLLTKKPKDGPARMFLERCRGYAIHPPPEGWTGEYEHKAK
ncbi:MAG: adenylate/guanylate cyclase domain-containing protein [Geothrix sp.]|nr:adenylate/guanylate cyclase domain-containing protein [Geothrix sp.]